MFRPGRPARADSASSLHHPLSEARMPALSYHSRVRIAPHCRALPSTTQLHLALHRPLCSGPFNPTPSAHFLCQCCIGLYLPAPPALCIVARLHLHATLHGLAHPASCPTRCTACTSALNKLFPHCTRHCAASFCTSLSLRGITAVIPTSLRGIKVSIIL